MNKIIVIEGACDGIGKTTQFNLLKKYFEENGYEVITHHFPSYNTIQGKLVEEYLKGNFGEIKTLSPYLINSFYAIDRKITWEKELKSRLENNPNSILLLDRYVTSSLIYQSVTIDGKEEKEKFINFVIDYEYNKLGIPKPDKVIFLKAPYNLIKEMRMSRKENEGIEKDIHEKDEDFMEKVYNNALFVSNYLNFDEVECSNGKSMLSIEEIQTKIRKKIK